MRLTNFAALLGKEWKESFRKYRFLIAACFFLFFGLASPIIAKFTPELVKKFAASEGAIIKIPSPTFMEAMGQYIKNLSQVVVPVLIFISMGSMAGEKEKGTAAFVLVKPVSRTGLLLAKWGTLLIIIAAGILLGGSGCYLYTCILFNPVPVESFLLMNLMIFLNMATFITLTLLFNTLAKNQVVAGVLAFFCWILASAMSVLPGIGKFLPGSLVRNAGQLIKGQSMLWEPAAGSLIIILTALLVSALAFHKWEP